jgi:hypothetical protein
LTKTVAEPWATNAAAFVAGYLELVHDSSPRELQPLAFLAAFDLVDVEALPAASGRALVLFILPIRLNRFAFEASCHMRILACMSRAYYFVA